MECITWIWTHILWCAHILWCGVVCDLLCTRQSGTFKHIACMDFDVFDFEIRTQKILYTTNKTRFTISAAFNKQPSKNPPHILWCGVVCDLLRTRQSGTFSHIACTEPPHSRRKTFAGKESGSDPSENGVHDWVSTPERGQRRNRDKKHRYTLLTRFLMYMYVQYGELKVWTFIIGHLLTVPVVLFQNTNWIFTFKNGVLLWILEVLERRKSYFTWPASCFYTFVKCFFCWSWWYWRDVCAICEGAGSPCKEKQKLLLLVPGALKGYPRNLRGREPLSRKGVHLSAANTKWRILTHSVSWVVCDLLCARVTAEDKLEGSQKCVGESLTHWADIL